MRPDDPQPESADPATGVSPSPAAPFERLLVPVDFSSAARAAFALAMRMAHRWGSEVILFHVPSEDENDEFLDHTGVAWGRSDVIQQALEHLQHFAEIVVPGSTQRVVIDAEQNDDPVKAVARACQRHAPSALVLGTHPRDRRRWRRSLTERIAREVTCAVVLVRGEPEAYMDPDT